MLTTRRLISHTHAHSTLSRSDIHVMHVSHEICACTPDSLAFDDTTKCIWASLSPPSEQNSCGAGRITWRWNALRPLLNNIFRKYIYRVHSFHVYNADTRISFAHSTLSRHGAVGLARPCHGGKDTSAPSRRQSAHARYGPTTEKGGGGGGIDGLGCNSSACRSTGRGRGWKWCVRLTRVVRSVVCDRRRMTVIG